MPRTCLRGSPLTVASLYHSSLSPVYLSTLTVVAVALSRFYSSGNSTHFAVREVEGIAMEVMKGTVETYDHKTGVGVIAMDRDDERVRVDLTSSTGIWLKQGQRVQFSRIHRPEGVFASNIKIIQ
ncbi:cold shock domain-containing protein [Pseudomonas sp. CFBP13509]|uniref:cold shock domain-containing protein n=1 Tax=Pseudomonas sp. CFBP13509 TaxID=2184008 RepID=UPI001F5458F8|nr:cold shock domain-containing protein [Pseudomonas sp. CFBP13509]